MKWSVAKARSFLQVHFVLNVQFFLTFTFDKAVLYENVALSFVVLLAKKRYSNFLREVLVFQKTCF